eukprot:333660-Amphidinium_carterae.1
MNPWLRHVFTGNLGGFEQLPLRPGPSLPPVEETVLGEKMLSSMEKRRKKRTQWQSEVDEPRQ